MSRKESHDMESQELAVADIESLLTQMRLRAPTENLDDSLSRLFATGESEILPASARECIDRSSRIRRYGWSTVLITSAASMLLGFWLGQVLLYGGGVQDQSGIADAGSAMDSGKKLTPVSFNRNAFELLHGHSQQDEFENCGQCHKSTTPDEIELDNIFKRWFYGDADFFEVHPNGVNQCSDCHVDAKADGGGLGDDPHRGFGDLRNLANCMDCHRVDADGFDGFENDWRSFDVPFKG